MPLFPPEIGAALDPVDDPIQPLDVHRVGVRLAL